MLVFAVSLRIVLLFVAILRIVLLFGANSRMMLVFVAVFENGLIFVKRPKKRPSFRKERRYILEFTSARVERAFFVIYSYTHAYRANFTASLFLYTLTYPSAYLSSVAVETRACRTCNIYVYITHTHTDRDGLSGQYRILLRAPYTTYIYNTRDTRKKKKKIAVQTSRGGEHQPLAECRCSLFTRLCVSLVGGGGLSARERASEIEIICARDVREYCFRYCVSVYTNPFSTARWWRG